MMGKGHSICITIFCIAFFGVAQPFFGQDPAHNDPEKIPGSAIRLNLSKAVSMALEYNGRSKVSRAEVDAALARHKQALSAWWPEFSAKLNEYDSHRNFFISC
jgi:outer membrane protein TolC